MLGSRTALGGAIALVLGAFIVYAVNAQQGRNDMVDITETGPNGLPIIFWRIEQDDRKAVRALINAGMDVNIRGFQQSTPTIAAASANAWITTDLLLQLGADPMATNRLGFTLPWLANKAQMNPDAPEGQALGKVRARLMEAGLMTRIYEPAEVKALVDRRAWPPA